MKDQPINTRNPTGFNLAQTMASQNPLGKTSQSVRFGPELGRLNYNAHKLRQTLENLADIDSDGFCALIDIKGLGLKITINSFEHELGEMTVQESRHGTLQITADSVLNDLEAGGPGAFRVDDWSGTIAWVGDLVTRLATLEKIWLGSTIFDAVAARNERLAVISQ